LAQFSMTIPYLRAANKAEHDGTNEFAVDTTQARGSKEPNADAT